MPKMLVGLDIETDDPQLKTAGWSWKYNEGYILNTALYYEAEDKVKVIAGLNNENCPFSTKQRENDNLEIKQLFQNENVSIVGANLQYDIGWLLHEYGMSTYDVKCSFIDVLQAESILNEFDIHSLEEVSWKYLKYGKTKDEIEEWVMKNIPHAKGDFRKYLKDAPWYLLCKYVEGDAKNPVKVWRKQLTKLKEQDLCSRCKLEFDCILPTLQMTMNGMPFNEAQREENLKALEKYRDILKAEFEKKYDFPNFKVTSSKHIASLCDKYKIPYRCKITLKGYKNELFGNDYMKIDTAYAKAKRIVSSFQYVKSIPVAYVPSEMAERTCDLLTEEGFMWTCSANVDKKFFASQRDNYPIIATIADWKLAEGIISKILGNKFTRFLCKNEKGEYVIKPQFNITDTISFRYSSVKPNGQQIPSKGGFTIHVDDKEVEVSFPKLTRALFTASKGCVFGKIDYGQIEYRLICNIACGEAGEEVRRQYRENPHMDFHQYVVDLTGLSRKYAKNMSFGVSFGMGLKSMAESFGWTMERAEEISEQYHQHMPFVAPTLALVGDVAVKRGYIKTVCGSHARLPNPNKKYTMLNRYTQGSGGECLKSSIVQAYKEGIWQKLKIANTVHDELNAPYLQPTEECMINFYRMAEIMRTSVKGLKVPLEAEIELGDNWAETKEISDWIGIRDNEPDKWNKLSEELRTAVNICEKLKKEGRVS